MKHFLLLVLAFLLVQCSINKKITVSHNPSPAFQMKTLTLYDQARKREIPIAIYQPRNEKNQNNIPILLSHGYGQNKGGDYLRYSYLTEFLASKGYFVVSIQHELPTDELLAMTGKLQETRRPNWERGVQNIYFVLQAIKKDFPNLKYQKLGLIGHSNGGDMTVLFAHQYPELVNKIISMDNRRMGLPRTAHPQVFTLRSNDYPADESVLPTAEEAKKYGMSIQFTNINHSNMDNDANETERAYLENKILSYLKK